VQGGREGKLGPPELRESWAYLKTRKTCCVSGVKGQSFCSDSGSKMEQPHMKQLEKNTIKVIEIQWTGT